MIKKWHLKAVIQKAISFVPVYGHQINFLFQKYITKGVQLTDHYFGLKSRHLFDNFKNIREHQGQDVVLLEIGSGWYPTIPIGMYLLGIDKVLTYDIVDLMEKDNVIEVGQRFLKERGALESKYGVSFDDERVRVLQDALANQGRLSRTELLKQLGIEYITGDLVGDNLIQDKGVNTVVSNNTFEHISKPLLERLMDYLAKTCAPETVMTHFIDMTDHYAHLDSSITVYNFLKFSPSQWRWIDNSIQPMNRLRFPEYIKLHERFGFVVEEIQKWPYNLADLDRQTIHADFEQYRKEDIALCHAYVVSRLS